MWCSAALKVNEPNNGRECADSEPRKLIQRRAETRHQLVLRCVLRVQFMSTTTHKDSVHFR
jgi:hypothetical protein